MFDVNSTIFCECYPRYHHHCPPTVPHSPSGPVGYADLRYPSSIPSSFTNDIFERIVTEALIHSNTDVLIPFVNDRFERITSKSLAIPDTSTANALIKTHPTTGIPNTLSSLSDDTYPLDCDTAQASALPDTGYTSAQCFTSTASTWKISGPETALVVSLPDHCRRHCSSISSVPNIFLPLASLTE